MPQTFMQWMTSAHSTADYLKIAGEVGLATAGIVTAGAALPLLGIGAGADTAVATTAATTGTGTAATIGSVLSKITPYFTATNALKIGAKIAPFAAAAAISGGVSGTTRTVL